MEGEREREVKSKITDVGYVLGGKRNIGLW